MTRTGAPARRTLASVLSAALIASAALIGVAAPAQAAPGPSVSVDPALVDRAGETVTITGENFDPAGSRGNGIYLSIQPADRVGQTDVDADGSLVWIGAGNEDGEMAGVGRTAPMNEDGSFRVEVPVPAYSEAGWVVYTRGAHGMSFPANETVTPIEYAASPLTPTSTTLTASETTVEVGTAIDLTASVSPADIPGTVTFSGNGIETAAVPVGGGVAVLPGVELAVGVYTLHAAFAPEDAESFLPSSHTVEVTVTAPAKEWDPQIEVFLWDGVTPYTGQPVYAGEQLVVRGSGFDPEANIGGRGVPIPNTLPQGTYAVFGSFLEAWQPSSAAPSASRMVVSQNWVLTESVLDQVPNGAPPRNYQDVIRGQWVELSEQGRFEMTVDVADFANGLENGNWGIYTYGAGGVANADQELFVPIDFRDGERPFAPTLEVFLADGVTPYSGQPVYTGEQLVVRGSGFDPEANVGGRGVPIPNTLPQGTYAVFGSFLEGWQPSAAAPTSSRKVVSQNWVLAESVLDQVPAQYQGIIRGQWTPLSILGNFEMTVDVADFANGLENGNWGIYTYGAGGVANADQELSVAINYVGDRPAIEVFLADGETPYTGQELREGDVLVVRGTGFAPDANVGGMGQPIPADLPQGTFVVFGGFAEAWKPSERAPGSQRVMNPDSRVWALAESVLDQVPAEFRETIRSAWTPITDEGTFEARVTLKTPEFPLENGIWGIYTYPGGVGVPANPVQELSVPVTFTPPVPPQALIVGAGSVAQGETVTVRGAGFAPDEMVGATVYSEPVPIGSQRADAAGEVQFAWTVPADFEVGVHTFELAGATSGVATVEFTVTPAAEKPAEPTCVARAVEGATIQWNVMERFRSYVNGPIAKGSYSINWGSGSGAFNTDQSLGRVSYGGSADFTGHAGQLDVHLYNPRIRVTGPGQAQLILDVRSTGSAVIGNSDVNASGVVFATLSLPAPSVSADRISWSGASGWLTTAGAEALAGFYSAGEPIDPVSFTFPLGAEVPCDWTTDGELAATGDGPAGIDGIWFGAALLLLGAGLVALRRRGVKA